MEITDSVKIKNITLKNRIAIPPMVCFCWPDENYGVSQKNIEHYKALAEGGAGLIIVEATTQDFVQAALRAKKTGFDGVEIHGCHGYLLSCFFNSRTNVRTDEYGKDKSLFAKEVLQAVRKAC